MKRTVVATALIIALMVTVAHGETFRDKQQRYPRARQARAHTQHRVDSLYNANHINRGNLRIFIRAFKRNEVLEVWGANKGQQMVLLRSYDFTAYSGRLGPKRRQGDFQIPEGAYYIDRFNPSSKYHLSLGLNYPNDSDRLRATSRNPGGDIFIHGSAASIGCIPIGNKAIEELYTIAVDARSAGQTRIPVHIFPFRMSEENLKKSLENLGKRHAKMETFWRELKPIYTAFERHRLVPSVEIDRAGVYGVR